MAIVPRNSLRRSLALIPLLLATALGGLACSAGVSEEEIQQVRQQLQAESAKVAELQEKVGKAEVQQALLTVYLAWNRNDAEAFEAGFADRRRSDLPDSFGEPPITLRRVMNTTVSGDVATIHAMFASGTQRKSVLHSLVKEEGVWKIDERQQLSPKIHEGTTTVDVRLDDFGLVLDPSAILSGNVAFIVENVGMRPRKMILYRVPTGLDLKRAFEGHSPLPEEIDAIGSVEALKPGERLNVAFTEPLDSGRYVLISDFIEPADGGDLPSGANGMFVQFVVP